MTRKRGEERCVNKKVAKVGGFQSSLTFFGRLREKLEFKLVSDD